MKRRTKLSLAEVIVLAVFVCISGLLIAMIVPKLNHNKGDNPQYYQPLQEDEAEFPVNICSASSKELSLVPGITETMANRIVVYRDAYSITELSDLLNIKGIDEDTLDYIKGYVYIEN